tara:strand:- start:195 stop:503 length:309 start_codon:yes stop_codon:yes gene_type:complete
MFFVFIILNLVVLSFSITTKYISEKTNLDNKLNNIDNKLIKLEKERNDLYSILTNTKLRIGSFIVLQINKLDKIIEENNNIRYQLLQNLLYLEKKDRENDNN